MKKLVNCMKNLIVTEMFSRSNAHQTERFLPLSYQKARQAEILAIFKCEAEKYTVTKNYAATKEQITSKNSISNSLYKEKKQKFTSLDEEIDQYLNAKCEEEANQPLAFWKSNSEKFPSLSNMARTPGSTCLKCSIVINFFEGLGKS
ncbi:hypothetical protein VP01_3609g4 [Puccinia sorghi]|uniref:HAT C-terminal dimerisation domain-containing protein n=1 Tax=Puccinia sorghi TaxID=27349 RepID=A0A0L6UWZ0_9BASI|nr:hypothetical protein VP01_3609g4 [Puccinia sorghi]